MTPRERAELVLAFARVLYVNGQATEQIVAAAERLGTQLGLHAELQVRWGELELRVEDEGAKLICAVAAQPIRIDMGRVASTMQAIEELATGELTPHAAQEAIVAISKAPTSPTWLFALATATGGVALALLSGVRHVPAAALVFVSAGAGAIFRRVLAPHRGNEFLQPFGAALLAGIIGALAVRHGWSSSLRLVAVCPCMVLVPGAHLLNGAIDLVQGRIRLGAARLTHATFVIASISTGLLLGLGLLSVSLAVDPATRDIPLWQDLLAAGIVIACFGVFYSLPPNMLAWPVVIGVLAHAVRWGVFTVVGNCPAFAAFVACLFVGLVLAPAARRWHSPFAAIAFASVISMIPGVLLFRMASGLVQLARYPATTHNILSDTMSDGLTSIGIVLAMSLGLVIPTVIIDRLGKGARRRAAGLRVIDRD